MGTDRLRKKIEEQQKVYRSLKEGNTDTVCYKKFQNGQWGTDDANYLNRLRLSYYLLYYNVDDEDTVVYLFEEELKDRENNSFQGIGSTLRILTHLLRKYNVQDKYANLFKRAKMANFDCACGYNADETVDDNFESNSLLDGIYLSQEMKYNDVMESMVDEWKRDITEWNISNRSTLISFNLFLGRNMENEKLYKEQLAETISVSTGRASDIISKYRDLIQCYLRMSSYDKAYHYCKTVIEATDYEQIKKIRLFGDILEACFEIIVHDPAVGAGLWGWAKKELQSGVPSSRYRNLYTKGIAAAKAVNDPYAKELEQEYKNWKARL